MKSEYVSPFSSRYSSKYMSELFSPDTRYTTWRKLWISLAKAEKTFGLDISDEQIADLENNLYNIDYAAVADYEKITRHDVMSHIKAYGDVAPKAAGIIHLGATSCFATDNADLIIYKKALEYIRDQLLAVMANLYDFAKKHKATPALGYTHYQPAQPTTVGKRATLWLQDFTSDYKHIDFVLNNLKFLGSRGATGTEASFEKLFDSGEKIDKMNAQIASDFGFSECYDVCGQTYPRKVDGEIADVLCSVAESAYRFAQDIRLLQHDGELEEPHESGQIGSSAMAYKRNPMRSERICSLARYMISIQNDVHLTAASQWLERTLDDSANRRIVMPEMFLCTDAILILANNVSSGLCVNEKVINARIKNQIPFIATENILMEAVKRGGDRQKLHEIIRVNALAVKDKMAEGAENDLFDRLEKTKEFAFIKEEKANLINPDNYIGRSVEQVDKYLDKLSPLLCSIPRKTEKIDL